MADFRINVVVDPSRVPQGTRVVERQLTRIENRANLVRTGLIRMLGPLAGGAAILAAVRSMARFEEAIATVKAVTSATGEEFDRLSERALRLGRTTRFSATQAADALVSLSRAGFSVDEALASVDDTLNLAQSASIGLAEAADITATAIRGFGLEAADAERVTDVLVATSNKANTTVSELGQGIKFVAPIAAALGKSIGETSAALGVLSDSGLKATLAGTGLRRVLGELASPSDKLRTLLSAAGKTIDEVNPKTNDLADVVQVLADVGIEAGEALDIFGQRGAPAVLNLVKNVDKLRRLNEEMAGVGGTAKRVAKTLDDTLNGAIFRAKSAIDGLVQSLGRAGASDFFVTLLDAVAASMNFLSDNAATLTNVILALGVAISVNLVRGALGAAIPAMRALALSLTLSGGAANVAATAFARLNIATLANPWILAAAAITAASVALKLYIDDLNAAGRIMDQIVQDQRDSFNSMGQQIRVAKNELKGYNDRLKAGEQLSDSQISRMAVLEERIGAFGTASRKAAEAQAEITAARKAGEPSAANLLASLDQEAKLLATLSREKHNQARAEQEIQSLLAQGIIVTPEQREAIGLAVERNDSLKLQKAILEEIKGPQEAFNVNSAALNALMESGAITATEFATKMEDLKAALQGDGEQVAGLGIDENALDRLREAVALRESAAGQGQIVAQALALENQLRKDGVEITREVQDEIAQLLVKQQQLTAEEQKRAEAVRTAARAAGREERLISQLERRINGTAALADEQRRLNLLFSEGRITAEQYALAQEDIELKGLSAARSLEAGFSRAFIKLKQEAEDLAAVGEKVIDVFANKATDALVEFATTGKFSFKEFASSMLQELVKIIARLLIVQALQAAIGAIGGGGGAIANTAANVGAQQLDGQRANGGPVQAGRSYLVGEKGPEIMNTNRSGTVIPNGAQQQASPVNVQVVNVQSEDDIPQAINDGAADDAIINAIARNKDRVNQVTQ